MEDRAAEREALAEPARQVARQRLLAALEAGHLDREPPPFGEPRRRHAVELGVEADVLIDGQQLVERELLRHVADAAPSPPPGSGSTSSPPTTARAGGGLQQAAQHPDGGRFSGAVAPEEAEDLALVDRERHVVHGDETAEAARQVVDDNGGHGYFPSARSSRASASRTLASACVRSSPAWSSATCASSTSVLVATPASNRSPSDPARLGGGTQRVGGGRHRGAGRFEVEAALPDLDVEDRVELREPLADRPLVGGGLGDVRPDAPEVVKRPGDVHADVPRRLPRRRSAGRSAGSGCAKSTPPPRRASAGWSATAASRRSPAPWIAHLQGLALGAGAARVGHEGVGRPDRLWPAIRGPRRLRAGVSGASPIRRAQLGSAPARGRCAPGSAASAGASAAPLPTSRRSAGPGRPSGGSAHPRHSASMRFSDSSTTRTASVAVTMAQKARVTSSFRVVSGRGDVERRCAGLCLRGALERVGPAERVNRPLKIETGPIVVRNVRVDHAGRPDGGWEIERGDVVRPRVAGLGRQRRASWRRGGPRRRPRPPPGAPSAPRSDGFRRGSGTRPRRASGARGDLGRAVTGQHGRRADGQERESEGVHDTATLLMNTSSSDAGIARTLVTSIRSSISRRSIRDTASPIRPSVHRTCTRSPKLWMSATPVSERRASIAAR